MGRYWARESVEEGQLMRFVFVFFTGLQGVLQPPQRRPHFGRRHKLRRFGCYGHPRAKTPVIDRLAKDGVRFTVHWPNGTECSPTRTALLTGRYPQRAGGLNAPSAWVMWGGTTTPLRWLPAAVGLTGEVGWCC